MDLEDCRSRCDDSPTRTHDESVFQTLKDYLSKVPSIDRIIGCGVSDDGRWWVKLTINIDHPLAWRVVQELGHVLNYVSLDERLPTVFKPVSPPPYLNGGPRDFLCWIIESKDEAFRPETCAEWLVGRLPRPVNDSQQWKLDNED
jgi:hypothetical protein